MKLLSIAKAIYREPELTGLLIREEEPVMCVHAKTGQKKKMSFRALYDNNRDFWKNPTSLWNFYLSEERLNQLTAELRDSSGTRPYTPGYQGGDASRSGAEEKFTERSNFGDRYEEILDLPRDKKIDVIKDHTRHLNSLLAAEKRDPFRDTEALTNSTMDVSLVNKSLIEEALKLGDAEAKGFSTDLVNRTHDLIISSTSLIDENVLKDDLLHSLVNRSNGTVVQHMTRTYIRSVSFLLYYNKKILNSSLSNRIRVDFKKKYKTHYSRLLSHFHSEDIVLERVFHSGLQAISTQQIHTFATGFLLHDVGKAADIDYHEGNAEYDRAKIVNHVKQGYLALMNKTLYPAEVSLITGYHHEYYGHPSGYGFYRANLSRHLQQFPKHQYRFLISYTLKPVLTFETFAFFPAKVLEIIDVFDALTDPKRKYRKPLNAEEALDLMKKEFVEENLKIDPVLFALFGEYQRTCHSEEETGRG